jgi:hypothetical protein
VLKSTGAKLAAPNALERKPKARDVSPTAVDEMPVA